MKIKPFKCRASKIGLLMTNHTGKSYKEQYDDALFKKESLNERLNGFKNKECKSAIEIEYTKMVVICMMILSVDYHTLKMKEYAKEYLWYPRKKISPALLIQCQNLAKTII